MGYLGMSSKGLPKIHVSRSCWVFFFLKSLRHTSNFTNSLAVLLLPLPAAPRENFLKNSIKLRKYFPPPTTEISLEKSVKIKYFSENFWPFFTILRHKEFTWKIQPTNKLTIKGNFFFALLGFTKAQSNQASPFPPPKKKHLYLMRPLVSRVKSALGRTSTQIQSDRESVLSVGEI